MSAESDFSLSEVFAGAVSPAGLAAAAAASSAADLFQSAPPGPRVPGGVASASIPTPRARTGGGMFGERASPSTSSPARPGSVVSAVAEAAAEMAEEEQARRGGRRISEEGDSARDRRQRLEAIAASAVVRSGPEPVQAASSSPEDDAPAQMSRMNTESPPTMQGASLPTRLALPQAMLSPTSPTGGGDGSGHLPSAAAGPRPRSRGASRVGGVESGRAVDAAGTADLALSPGTVMLSPGTDSDRGSTPSPRPPFVQPELIGGGGRGGDAGVGGRTEAAEERRGLYGSGRGEGTGGSDGGQKRHAGEERSLSPWVTMPESVPAQKEEEQAAGARAEGATGGGVGVHEGEHELSSVVDARTFIISPQSASSSAAGSSLWRSSETRGAVAFPALPSMGGAGADEAKGGLREARAGNMRALGTLDLMQVREEEREKQATVKIIIIIIKKDAFRRSINNTVPPFCCFVVFGF